MMDVAPEGGMTFTQIAARLGCSRGWVQKIYHSAMRKLQRKASALQ
jgi:DNA-directed RNA polymerase specialized sigma24 family protein